ncbi:MAG: hypothetical protein WC044_08375 [Crocinitomicaceae bacterium]
MHKVTTVFFLTLILASCCDSNQKETEAIADPLVALSEKLGGLWISDSYLKNIETTKSIYKSRKYATKIQGFNLDKKTLLTGTSNLEGFTEHEGGYSSPIHYDSTHHKFVNDLTRLSDYPFFPEPFDLNFDGKKILTLYFPKTKTADRYRKLDFGFQTELRKLLIAGKYKSSNKNSAIQFDQDGTVHNFKGFHYFELIADFGLAIEYDALVFYTTAKGGNWSDGEIYKFEIIANRLQLQPIKANWETMEHEISDEILVLEEE